MLKFVPALLFLALTACTATSPSGSNGQPTPAPVSGDQTVSFSVANTIVQQRCSRCHGASGGMGGVSLVTPQDLQSRADRIKARAVLSQGMPQGNITQMTADERVTLGRWIDQGAKLD
jgi:uncharacterized membrane protein